MPFYLRKSVSLGPFRFNLSKSGLGLSAGVKGFRVGSGPRGHYVHAGMGGIYYRSSLGGKKRRPGKAPRPAPPAFADDPAGEASERIPFLSADGITMLPVDSGDVGEMQATESDRVLAEISRARRRLPLAVMFPMALLLPSPWLPGFVALAPAALLIGYLIDLRRRNRLLLYSFDDGGAGRYQLLCDAWDEAAACAGIWFVAAAGRVDGPHARKRSSGAGTAVVRHATRLGYGLPGRLKSNVKPPMVRVGRQTLYFMPDVILVEEKGRLGGVPYAQATVRSEDAHFVEEGVVPKDTEVITTIWKYQNRDGSPDRRFRDNRRIPLCRYGQMSLRSASGLTEVLQFSVAPAASRLEGAIEQQATSM